MNDNHSFAAIPMRSMVHAALARLDALLEQAGSGAPVTGPARAFSPGVEVGGPDLDLAPRDGFLSAEFRSRFRPGRRRCIYVANCTSLIALSTDLDIPLRKPGITDPDAMSQRFDRLSRDRTGAVWHYGERHFVSRAGWSDWFPCQIRPALAPSPGSPVTVGDRMIAFPVPDGTDAQAIEFDFDTRVNVAALDRWSMTDAARARCAKVGLDERRLRRSTPYSGGADMRLSPATEICLFDPVTGPDRLIRIIEDVLLDHVLGGPARASA